MAVVDSNDRCAVVLAGAGTGKTKTAVAWVANKIGYGVPPMAIAMLTFTKKAAAEMMNRITHMTGGASGVFAGTFHSFAYRQLRMAPQSFGFEQNRISLLSPSDSLDVLEQELNAQGVQTARRVREEDIIRETCRTAKDDEEGAPPKNIRTVRPKKGGTVERVSLQDVAAIMSDALNRAVSPEKELMRASGSKQIVAAYCGYVAFMLHHGMVDYDHLLSFFLAGLKSDPAMGEQIASTYQYLLVDEVQDNNATQFEIVALLPVAHKLLIGDIQQSIYRFRGAFPQGVLDFIDANPDCKEYRLERNYRSKQNILDVANHVVQSADKALRLVADRPGVGNVREVACYSQEHLAMELHKIATAQVARFGAENVAILSWTLNSPALFFLEQSLKARGISCRRVGGKGVLGAKESLDFCAFLRVAHNERDILGLRRVLMLLPKVGPKKANDLMTKIRSKGSDPDMWDADVATIRGPIKLLRSAETSFASALTETLDALQGLYKERYPDDWQQKMINPQIIVEHCLATNLSLEEAIEEFVMPKRDPKEDKSEKVTISTIHSAKGLEWQNVSVLNAGDYEFGHRETEEDELVRLMYVAITRAKDNLALLRIGPRHRFLPEEI